jgi:predicted lipoprotein with Yx(FWY)xxD motif
MLGRELKMKPVLASLAAIAVLAIAGCGGDDDDSDTEAADVATETEAATTEAAPTKPAAGTGTTIKVADSEFGKVLFDGDDGAIYLFDKETSTKPDCYGACAEAWPPVVTEGAPQAGAGADAAKLGTAKRTDGTTQVTYNGHPLYYYVDDGPGEIGCHNVEEFGGLWLVVDPSGNAVQ